MKKIFLALSLLLGLSVTAVQAQEDVKVRFGVTAGFAMTKWNGDLALQGADLSGSSFNPGFRLGAVAELQMSAKWSVQPELLFSYEGTKLDSIGSANAMYIKVPILVYRNFQNIGPGQLSPALGPYFSFGIGGSADGEQTLGYDGIAEKFDWGLQLRVNYELFKYVEGLFANIGYEQGLTSTYNMGLMVGVGYKFAYSKWLKSAKGGIFSY